jgi:Protein of unknown function (DUF1524)
LEKVYISDDEFVSIFVEKDFSYSTPSDKKLIEYILFQIECKLKNENTFLLKDATATIEHILPQSDENIEDKTIYKYLNNIANFTLLENSKNQDSKNLAFENKIAVYKTSKYKLTNTLTNNTEWGVSEIKTRQTLLAKKACDVWKINF